MARTLGPQARPRLAIVGGGQPPERDRDRDRDGDRRPVEGFLQSDNIWVLIPVMALSIPIIAVAGSSPLVWVVGAVAVIAAVTAALRHLMVLRHRLRLDELAAQERLSLAERERFAAIDRLVDGDRLEDRLGDLRLPEQRPEPRPDGDRLAERARTDEPPAP
jgi:hypothetical protein